MKWNKEVKEEVKLWQSNDYDIKEDTPEYVLLERNNATPLGHLVVFFLTVWFTLGIGNLIYYVLSKKTRKVMK